MSSISKPRQIIHVTSYDALFDEPQAIYALLMSTIHTAGYQLELYEEGNDEKPITQDELKNLVSRVEAVDLHLMSPRGPALLSAHWFPANDPILILRPAKRGVLSLFLPGDSCQESVFPTCRTMVDQANGFWAELNDENLTDTPYVGGGNAHIKHVPPLATANYFGPEYVELLGGKQAFLDAGFQSVEEWGEGLFVRLPAAADQAEYLEIRTRIQTKLSPNQNVFETRTGAVPVFRHQIGMPPITITIEKSERKARGR